MSSDSQLAAGAVSRLRAAGLLIDPTLELQHYVYLIRLFTFLLLIVGIVDKNRRSAG
jgi:hypothetical protein